MLQKYTKDMDIHEWFKYVYTLTPREQVIVLRDSCYETDSIAACTDFRDWAIGITNEVAQKLFTETLHESYDGSKRLCTYSTCIECYGQKEKTNASEVQ